MDNFGVKLELISLEDLILVSDLGYSALGMLGHVGNARRLVDATHSIQVTPQTKLQETRHSHSSIDRPAAVSRMLRVGNQDGNSRNRSEGDTSSANSALFQMKTSLASGLQYVSEKEDYLTLLVKSINGPFHSSELLPTGTVVQNELPAYTQGINFSIDANIQIQLNQLDQLANNLSTTLSKSKTTPRVNTGIARSESSYISQNVVINADNDNRSTVTHHIPQKYDFEASAYQYQQGANKENDLVQLQTTGFIPDDAQATPGFNWYKISVSHNGKGRIEVWNSPSKQHLIPFNVQTSAYMGLDPSGIPRYLPGFWMEGLHISEEVGDITVTVTVSQIVNNQSIQIDLTPVRVSVTPVIMSKEDYIMGPFFINSANTTLGINAHFEAEVQYVKPHHGKVDFVQFWDSFTNRLGEYTFGIERDGLSNLALRIKAASQQPNFPNAAKTTIPFLDIDRGNEAVAPFYASSSDNHQTTPTITMHDYPSFNGLLYNGSKWKSVGITDSWSNYITFNNTEHGETVVYPLYVTLWSVFWNADTYVVGAGATNISYPATYSTGYEEKHNFETGQVAALNWANYVWELSNA